MMSSRHKISLFPLLIFLFITPLFGQTTYHVGTASELTTAISSSVSGDIINVTNNIAVTAQVSLTKNLTFQGNGYTITVPNTGLDDMGRFNTSTSSFRVFAISGSGVAITMNNLTLKGGFISSGSGGVINVGSGTSLTLNNCVVSNSGGGGLGIDGGVVYLNNSLLIRNAAQWGGGFLMGSSSRMYVEQSTISENRSTSTGGGGGGGEVQSSAILYMNNSTLSNNQSTEIGGAINLYLGTVYLVNCSVTGNVAYGTFTGGGVGNNGGNLYAANTLFAHNYRRTGGSVSIPPPMCSMMWSPITARQMFGCTGVFTMPRYQPEQIP